MSDRTVSGSRYTDRRRPHPPYFRNSGIARNEPFRPPSLPSQARPSQWLLPSTSPPSAIGLPCWPNGLAIPIAGQLKCQGGCCVKNAADSFKEQLTALARQPAGGEPEGGRFVAPTATMVFCQYRLLRLKTSIGADPTLRHRSIYCPCRGTRK
jgi:hypothetical protein